MTRHHDTKKARDALGAMHERACLATSGPVYMSIPANPDHDADIILADVIDERDRLHDLLADALHELRAARVGSAGTLRDIDTALKGTNDGNG